MERSFWKGNNLSRDLSTTVVDHLQTGMILPSTDPDFYDDSPENMDPMER